VSTAPGRPTEPRPRVVLPSLVWLLLAIASFVAAFGVWQNQRLERLRPPPIVAPPATEPAGGNPSVAPTTPVTQTPPAAPVPALATSEDPASAPMRQLEPQAGRQVLRCVTKGRVTYRDLNAGCPEGAAERVTVFPTEGVGRPR
jgi:hypothetical protein